MVKNTDRARDEETATAHRFTEHSALLRHNARALANEIVCYILLIL